VALLLDFKLDESYTPSKVAVRAGTTVHDLRELQAVELEEPAGWVDIPLRLPGGTCAPGRTACPSLTPPALTPPLLARRRSLKAYFVQLAILANHQNGRDTHIRQVKVFGPRLDAAHAAGRAVGFTTDEFAAYATLR